MRLAYAPVPAASRRAGDAYRDAVRDFLASGAGCEHVPCGTRRPRTLYMGLFAAARQLGEQDRVAVHRSGDDLFLLRKRSAGELFHGLFRDGCVEWGPRVLTLPAGLVGSGPRREAALRLLAREIPMPVLLRIAGPAWDRPLDAKLSVSGRP